MTIEVLTEFDYSVLDAESRIVVQQRTGEIKSLVKRSAQDIVEIGQKLIEVKACLGHGNFGNWLATESEWSDQTALNYMNVAHHFAQIPNYLEFAPKALYMLSAPSTPESAREEAIETATAGTSITPAKAGEIVQKHKSSSGSSRSGSSQSTSSRPQPGQTVQIPEDRQIQTTSGKTIHLQAGQAVEVIKTEGQVIEVKTDQGETVPLLSSELTADRKSQPAQSAQQKGNTAELLDVKLRVAEEAIKHLEALVQRAIGLFESYDFEDEQDVQNWLTEAKQSV